MGILSENIYYYDFNYVHKENGNIKDIIETLYFSFKSTKTNLRYIAQVEHYNLNLYAIKFYLKNHKDSPNRFTVLTGKFEARPVIHTCIAIMIHIYNLNHNASFAFIGSPSYKEIKREEENPKMKKENNTQRFRIYSTLMYTYFRPEKFEHFNSIKQSLYLMLNRASKHTKSEMQDMINEIYNIDINDLN